MGSGYIQNLDNTKSNANYFAIHQNESCIFLKSVTNFVHINSQLFELTDFLCYVKQVPASSIYKLNLTCVIVIIEIISQIPNNLPIK